MVSTMIFLKHHYIYGAAGKLADLNWAPISEGWSERRRSGSLERGGPEVFVTPTFVKKGVEVQ